MRPVLVDLRKRMRLKRLKGFKIAICGRFKRNGRATYWWRQTGLLLTGTATSSVDYSVVILKTKYGICSIYVWLIGSSYLNFKYPISVPFFLKIKKNKKLNIKYILLKKNFFFLKYIFEKKKISLNLKKNYVKIIIKNILFKYLYLNIFLNNMFILKKKIKKIILQKIFLPQYCIYKININNYINRNFIKIIPFIELKLLKRLNIRGSYKINKLYGKKIKNIKFNKYQLL